MKRFSLVLILIILCCSLGFTQIKITTDLEVGVNSSAALRPIIKTNDETTIYSPVISPVLGLWTKVKLGKRFSYSVGAQYLKVGDKSYNHRDRINQYHDYSTDNWYSITFQKISVPIILGYDFKIKKTTSTVYIGIKRNYFLKGEIEESYKYTNRKDPSNNSEGSSSDDPFATGSYMGPASRVNRGIFLGYGVAVSNKMSININYSIRQYTSYSRGCFGYSYYNNDLTLSVRYSFYSNLKKP